MNRTMKAIAAIMLMMVFAVGCNKPDEPNNGGNSGGGNNGNYDSDVRVTTYTPQHITQSSAVCGGDVIVVQGLSLNRLGVCWSKNLDPTVNDAHFSTANWTEPYVCTITGLELGTTYYVRAFALRGLEYYYGENKCFTTEYSHVSDINVTTYTPQDVTQTTAVCGGEVIATDELVLNRLGVCWSKEPNPTIEEAGLFTTNWSEPYFCTITGLEPGVTYHVRAFALYDAECYYGEDKSFTTESSSGTYDGHDYVDLDLPSGTLWATCNVGANAPWEYGDYFAWGEPQPKDSYYWSNYNYCNGTNNTLTKYNNLASYGYNGYTDNLVTLLPEDDAATSNWGGEWCTPTAEQFEELLLNTTSSMASQNGNLGLFFVANNGNCIFLPCSGDYYGTEIEDLSDGYYWSSSLELGNRAWALIFKNSPNAHVGNGTRRMGLPVRPVCFSK